jgi:hypothetical protein
MRVAVESSSVVRDLKEHERPQGRPQGTHANSLSIVARIAERDFCMAGCGGWSNNVPLLSFLFSDFVESFCNSNWGGKDPINMGGAAG